MTASIDTTSEQHRRICEARTWLRQGYIESAKVDALMLRITEKRGKAAADELLEEMRRQWKRRHEWQGEPA